MYIIRIILIVLNFVVTIGVSTLLALSYFSSVISPSTVWWFSMIAIAAPALVVFTLLAFLYNLMRANVLAVVPLIVLIVGVEKIHGQFNFLFFKEYTMPSNSIRIASHNVRLFVDDEWNSALDSTVNMLKTVSPDIVAFQEYNSTSEISSDSLNSLFGRYDSYSTALFGESNGPDMGQGLAIFSKYPIIKRDKLLFNDDMCGMQWVDVVVKSDTLRIFNIHMKSNGIDRSDKSILSSSILSEHSVDSTEVSHLKSILRKVKSNSEIRAFHSDTIAQIIEKSPYKVILCGDLNDVPFSYAYSTIKGDLHDSFSERGNLYAYSYNQLYKLLKIDYIFTPDGYDVGRYLSFETPYSDHNPIVIDIHKNIGVR